MSSKIITILFALVFSFSLNAQQFQKKLLSHLNKDVVIFLKNVAASGQAITRLEGTIIEMVDDCVTLRKSGKLIFIKIDEISSFYTDDEKK